MLLFGCFYDPTGSEPGDGTAQTAAEVTSTGGSTNGTGGGAATTGTGGPLGGTSTGGDVGTSTGSGTTMAPIDPTTTADPGGSTTTGATTGTTTGGEDSSSSGESSTSIGCVELPYFADSDKDGYGDSNQLVIACGQPDGYVVDDTDCDDKNGMSYPGAEEVCGMGDNDCDGKVDEYNPPVNVVCGCSMFEREGLLYHFCGDSQSWDAAETRCEARGAALTEDLDQAQHDWFLARLTEIDAAPGSWWLGGRTAGDNTMFKWLDGSAIGAFQPWSIGYPSNSTGTDCLRLASPTTPIVANKWVDAKCDEKRPYICKGPLP